MKPGSWTSELETGLAALDSDHKLLMEKADRLKQASSGVGFPELKSALLELKIGIAAHFAREETMMRDCKYEATQEHEDEHQRLMAEIQEKIDALEAFENCVLTFGRHVHQWMFQHIADKDALFGRAVVSQTGTSDRRHERNESNDAFGERRLNELEPICWPDDVSTGVEAIDAYYPAMIDLLNRIIATGNASDRHLLATLIEQLGNATESHFREEEAMMSAIDFEHSATHRAEHRLLLDEFSDLVDDWRSDRISAELLCRFVYHWMLNHVAASDIPLGAAIARQTA